MNLDYSKNKLKKQLSTASEIKKAFGINAKRVMNRLDDIEASPNLAVLIKIPAANCHSLSGDMKGKWALDISANFRMIFEISDNPIPKTEDNTINTLLVTNIRILEIIDYH